MKTYLSDPFGHRAKARMTAAPSSALTRAPITNERNLYDPPPLAGDSKAILSHRAKRRANEWRTRFGIVE
jgi:hypothetical protein